MSELTISATRPDSIASMDRCSEKAHNGSQQPDLSTFFNSKKRDVAAIDQSGDAKRPKHHHHHHHHHHHEKDVTASADTQTTTNPGSPNPATTLPDQFGATDPTSLTSDSPTTTSTTPTTPTSTQSPQSTQQAPVSYAQSSAPVAAPAPASNPAPTTAPAPTYSSGSSDPTSTNLQQAQADTTPTFNSGNHVLEGNESQLDSQITNEHTFGEAVDTVAKQYGLDPAMFRAQLEKESGAFNGPTGYLTAMHADGDLDRASANNTSLGLGQISQDYLDGGPWSGGGPGNARMGGQEVSVAQYDSSITVQLRMSASNDAQRIADNGGNVEAGLANYVNGSSDTSAPKAADYISSIDKLMSDPTVEGV